MATGRGHRQFDRAPNTAAFRLVHLMPFGFAFDG